MADQLYTKQWIRTHQAAYTTVLLAQGQYIAVGTEQGIEIFDTTGKRRLDYPTVGRPLPILQLAIDQEKERTQETIGPLYAATRTGQLIRLELRREPKEQQSQLHSAAFTIAADSQNLERDPDEWQFQLHPRQLYGSRHETLFEDFDPQQPGGIEYNWRSLSAATDLLAIGHLGPALELLDSDGHLLGRRHPKEGTATVVEGKAWSVALNAQGTVLYAGSAHQGINRVATLNTHTFDFGPYRLLEEGQRVATLAALPQDQGIAVALVEEMSVGRVVVYNPELEPVWDYEFEEPITALTVDPQEPLLAVGVGYAGQIVVMDPRDGRILASDLYLMTMVNDLDMRNGQILAAATEDGHAALIHYQPTNS